MRTPPSSLFGQQILLSLVCGLLLAIHSPAEAQQAPVPRMEMSGLNFRDEFDIVFSKCFGCLSRSMIKWRRDGGSTRSYRCLQADEFSQLILKQKNRGTPVETYLRTKGGACTTLNDGTRRCIVEREITTRVYIDESMPSASRTLFTLRVDIRASDGDIYTDIERDDFEPGAIRS